MDVVLKTERLLLRPFTLEDSTEVQRMAGDAQVAETTLVIPHPYPDGAAEAWISQHSKWRKEGLSYEFAIEKNDSSTLIGCISLGIKSPEKRGVLGYWIGREFWNNKFCSEATKRIIQFALQDLKLESVYAYHLAENAASGKVMLNAGMTQKSYEKDYVVKNGRSRDAIFYQIDREER